MIDRRNHLAGVVQEEVYRRVRRSFLLALGASLLAVFALGSSFVPISLSGDLLTVYGLFLAAFGLVLGLVLVNQFGGTFGDALAVAVWTRLRAEEHWRELGAGRIPIGAEQAEAWLASHPDEDSLPAQRLSALLTAGRLEDARQALGRYPTTTPYERFDKAVDGWFLDFVEGQDPPLDGVEAAAAAVEVPDEGRMAAASVALMRGHLAAAWGAEPYRPMAAARPFLGDVAAGLVGSRYIARTWTIFMAIAAALIGVALLAGKATGVWL